MMVIVRIFYSFFIYALTPLIALYLLRRANKQPEYRSHWAERFLAHYDDHLPQGAIWIHAVSVGETHAAHPLVRQLQICFPDTPIIFTHMTPTGRATSAQLFAEDAGIFSVYLPYDYPHAVRRFFAQLKPRFGIILETEIWLNLFLEAKKQGIPTFLVNARLSEHSWRAYVNIKPFVQWALSSLTGVAAQTSEDAARLADLGANSPEIFGNLKFDGQMRADYETLAAQFRSWCGARMILVLASTREGEEALLLSALPSNFSGLCILIPRHPQRFEAVAALLTAHNIPFSRRSDARPVLSHERVWLGDSMGELAAFYACADVAFIGGSLLAFGGQNLIEAAQLGVPIVMGESDFNFAEASKTAETMGALTRCCSASEVFMEAERLFHDEIARIQQGKQAFEFAQRYRGAAIKTASWIEAQLKKSIS